MKHVVFLFSALVALSASAQDRHIIIAEESLDPIVTSEWRVGSNTLVRKGKDLEGRTITASVVAKKFEITKKPYLATVLVPKVICKEIPGEGLGQWYDYWQTRSEGKAVVLSQAIRGITLNQAQTIVSARDERNLPLYFRSKPRSWDDFKAEILKIQRREFLPIARTVLVDNGDENARNLGYVTVDCRTEHVEDRIIDYKTSEKVIRESAQQVELEFRGGELLTGEEESFVLTWDGREANLRANSSYNTYQLSQRETTSSIVFTARGNRQQVTPSINPIHVQTKFVGGKIAYEVTNTAFDTEVGGKVVVTVATIGKSGWFKKTQGTHSVDLTGPKGEIVTDISPNSGAKYNVQFSAQILGSRFYNDRSTYTKNQSFVAPK